MSFFGIDYKAESFEFRGKTRYLVLDLTGLVRSTLDCVFLMWTMPMIYRCVHYLQELLKHPGRTIHSHPCFLPHLSRRCSIDGSPYCVFFFGGGGDYPYGRLPILVPQKQPFKILQGSIVTGGESTFTKAEEGEMVNWPQVLKIFVLIDFGAMNLKII